MIVYYGDSETSTNATSLRWPFFSADSPYIHSCFNLSTKATRLADSPYIHSCFNLSTKATLLADGPYIHSCFNLSTMATSLQRPLDFFGGQSIHSLLLQPPYNSHLTTQPLSSAPKVAVVERFNCIKFLKMPFSVHQEEIVKVTKLLCLGQKRCQ